MALIIKSEDASRRSSRAIALPLLLLSGVLLPMALAPAWLQTLSSLNPFTTRGRGAGPVQRPVGRPRDRDRRGHHRSHGGHLRVDRGPDVQPRQRVRGRVAGDRRPAPVNEAARPGILIDAGRAHPPTTEVTVAFRAELEDFSAFYERTYPDAYRTALAIVRDPGLAADATQDAYVKAYRDRARFRGDAPVAAWFHRILVNTALASLRRRASRPREIHVGEVPHRGTPIDATAGSADRLSVLAALADLEPRSRAAVVLRYYHDHDYATIGRILDTSPGNVGVILTRALDRLRTTLDPGPPAATADPAEWIGGSR